MQAPSDQIDLEQLMADLGRERYRTKIDSARRYDHQSDTIAGRYLMREAVRCMDKAFRKWQREQLAGGPYKDCVALLKTLKPGVASFIAVRDIINSIGRQTTILKAGFHLASLLEEEALYGVIRRADSRVWADLKRRMKRIRSANGKRRILADVMGKLHATFEPWPKKDKIRLGVVMVELVRQHTGLIEVHKIVQRNSHRQNMVVPTEKTLQWLEKSSEAHQDNYPFWLPSVVPPRCWVNPFDGGYHTNLIVRNPLVKTNDRRLLEDLERADMPDVYGAVNILQDTAWEINPDVYRTMRHFWDAGHPIADLPERMDDPRPVRPPTVDHDPEALKQYKKALSIHHQRIVATRSKRVLASKIMFMAEHFLDRAFYFPYQADFRGRLYTVPYFLQPQGPSQARGLLRFANGRPIENAAQAGWLAVHGANCYGVDKIAFSGRMGWVDEHEAEIRAVAKDPVECKWWADADKPWEFLAFCCEWAAYLDQGFGFVSRLPVSMDGSNNGLQIFSLLLRDRVGAEATNCVPSESPRDIYQDVADAVSNKLRDRDDAMAVQWLEFIDGRLPREATKRSVMTLPYGSTFHSCIHYTRDWYEAARKAKGSTPFERGYESSVYLARLIWAAITERVSGAAGVMDWMRGVADLFAEYNIPIRWTSPSGFPVKQGYMRYATKEIKTEVGDTVRWTSYRVDSADVSKQKQKNGISPNYVHSLDAAVLVKSVVKAHEHGIGSYMMIHDSYGVLAADAPLMAGVLRVVYADMFADDLLNNLRDELQKQLPEGTTLPPIPESGDLDVNEVKNSLYFFA